MNMSLRVVRDDSDVLTSREHVKAWFLINRTKIGALILATFSVLRGYMEIKNPEEVSRLLTILVELFIFGGGVTLAAGASKSDEDYEEALRARVHRRIAAGQGRRNKNRAT